MVVRHSYRPTGKPGDESSARHSREVRRAFDDLAKKLTTVQALAQAAQDGVDGLDGTSSDILYREYEVDFSAAGTASISTGNNTIDGLTWTGQAVTGHTFGLTSGSGLGFTVTGGATTNTNYNFSGTTTAAYLRLPISTLWAAMASGGVTPDATWKLVVQAYASTDTIASANSYWLCGLGGVSGTPASSSNRGVGAMRLIANGTQCFKSRGSAGSDGFNYQVSPNVIGVAIGPDSIGTAIGGTWTTAWPRMQYSMGRGGGSVQPYLDDNSHIVLAFATNNANGDMSIVVERLRARAWGVAA